MRGMCLTAVAILAFSTGGTSLGGGAKETNESMLKKIQGTWQFVSQEMDGKPRPKED